MADTMITVSVGTQKISITQDLDNIFPADGDAGMQKSSISLRTKKKDMVSIGAYCNVEKCSAGNVESRSRIHSKCIGN